MDSKAQGRAFNGVMS